MPTERGLTVSEVARRYRVGEDKVRGWVRRGELAAINTAAVLCGKPRWVILPEALASFEKRRTSEPPPAPTRRTRKPTWHDFFPDGWENMTNAQREGPRRDCGCPRCRAAFSRPARRKGGQ
jgi:hypothetical protein